jgi:hypothetical protein
MTLSPFVRAGCGLIGLAATLAGAAAQEPAAESSALVTATAKSQYGGGADLFAQQHSEERLRDGYPWASNQAVEATEYLQYEAQNVPLATEPPPLITELPPMSGPAYDPAPDALPPIVPYNTQFLMTWNSGSGDDLGIMSLDLREVLVFPRLPGLMLIPGFATHLLSGPDSVDLPGALYDNWIEVRWLKKFDDRWTADLAITPSLFTDYENLGSDAVRMQARAIALWSWRTDLQFAFGFLYLDREDIAALPMAGLIWTPNDDYKAELLFPRPRLMYRLSGDETFSRWVYVGGEFGGGSWAIERTGGGPPPNNPKDDIVTYSVLRFLVGYEAKKAKGFSPRVEAGFNFNRSVEFKSGKGDFDPDNTAMLRFGGSF